MRITRSTTLGLSLAATLVTLLFACGNSDRYLSGSGSGVDLTCQDCSGYCCSPPYLSCCKDTPCVEPDAGMACMAGDPPYVDAGAGVDGESVGGGGDSGGGGGGFGGTDGTGCGGSDGVSGGDDP